MSQTLKHILCVDDEADILEIARMALESVGGYKVSTCSNGREVLERVTQIDPDMVLLDVMMPSMDGPTVFAKLHNNDQTKHLPVVFMTAKVQPKEITGYVGMGAAGVVMKPFDPMKLPRELEALWKKFHAR